jgi:hypothetical protein
MDGNDMGLQFLEHDKLRQRKSWPEEKTEAWLARMSEELGECTYQAFLAALAAAIGAWAKATVEKGLEQFCVQGTDRLVLPFRPLILGGDDLVLLCHSSYAMDFVSYLSKEFAERSEQAAVASEIKPLWPATDDRLTISAGILYCNVSFPLHMAIPYAESLLNSAKGEFRRNQTEAGESAREPTPAAIDWDVITDTLVDTPSARRNRDLRFSDEEQDGLEVVLTRRPYLLSDSGDRSLASLLRLCKELGSLPKSVRARILPALQQPWSERLRFVASIAKRHEVLMKALSEFPGTLGQCWHNDDQRKRRATGLPDALLLLEEDERMNRPTAAQASS